MMTIDLTVGEPLVATEAEALALDGDLLRHYKTSERGRGIYRQHGEGVYHPEGGVPDLASTFVAEGLHSETLVPVLIYLARTLEGDVYWVVPKTPVEGEGTAERVVVYEHLWPNPHHFWVRPSHIFHSPTADGQVRFAPIPR